MPSPTDVITPSWASTTGASKLAMRCFRMSPISSLRMAMWSSTSVVGGGRSAERRLQLLKVGAHAVVDQPVADTDDQPADDRRVGVDLHPHGGSEPLAKSAGDLGDERLVRRDRGGDVRVHDAGGAVGEHAVLLEDAGEAGDPLAFDKQADHVADMVADPIEQVECEAHAVGDVKAWVVERIDDLPAAERLDGSREIVSALVDGLLLAGEREHRSGVAAGDHRACHQAPSLLGGLTAFSDSPMSRAWVGSSIASRRTAPAPSTTRAPSSRRRSDTARSRSTATSLWARSMNAAASRRARVAVSSATATASRRARSRISSACADARAISASISARTSARRASAFCALSSEVATASRRARISATEKGMSEPSLKQA